MVSADPGTGNFRYCTIKNSHYQTTVHHVRLCLACSTSKVSGGVTCQRDKKQVESSLKLFAVLTLKWFAYFCGTFM